MAISAAMVKELREKTGAGMMDCKKALVEVDGDLEKAVDWLRQKGMAKAAKKSGRATSEGPVMAAVSADGKTVAMSAAEGVLGRRSRDIGELKGAIKSGVSNYLFKTTKRSPMVIPVITKL